MTETTTATAIPARPTHVSQLVTVTWVAAFLQVDPQTVRRYVREGDLPAYRVGRTYRFDETTVREWLQARSSHPAGSGQPDLVAAADRFAAAATTKRRAR